MQSEPIAASTPPQHQIDASEPTNASQHGILPDPLQSTDLRDSHDEARIESTAEASGVDDSESSHGDEDTLPTEVRRLQLNEGTHKRPKASFQRISEYENALSPSPPRKDSEGPTFKVVKKKGNTLNGAEFEKFPNGTRSPLRWTSSSVLL